MARGSVIPEGAIAGCPFAGAWSRGRRKGRASATECGRPVPETRSPSDPPDREGLRGYGDTGEGLPQGIHPLSHRESTAWRKGGGFVVESPPARAERCNSVIPRHACTFDL